MPVKITGIGWVTAAGMGCPGQGDDFAMPDAELPEIKPRSLFSRPYPYFRRMDAYSRLGVVAVALALKDANLDQWTEKRDIGIIVSTEYGCLHTDKDYFETVKSHDGIGASPALFSYTLPSVFLGEAAIHFGLSGATFVVNSAGPLGQAGLQAALETLAAEDAGNMLCGICDLNGPPLPGANCHFPPGAVFLVLETRPGKNAYSYGSIKLGPKGRILFNETETEDIITLVQKCLAGYRTRH